MFSITQGTPMAAAVMPARSRPLFWFINTLYTTNVCEIIWRIACSRNVILVITLHTDESPQASFSAASRSLRISFLLNVGRSSLAYAWNDARPKCWSIWVCNWSSSVLPHFLKRTCTTEDVIRPKHMVKIKFPWMGWPSIAFSIYVGQQLASQ